MTSLLHTLYRTAARPVIRAVDDGLFHVHQTLGMRSAGVLFDVYNELGLDAQVPVIAKLLRRKRIAVSVTSGVIALEKLRGMLEERGVTSSLVVSPRDAGFRRFALTIITEHCTHRRWRQGPVAYLNHGSSAGDRSVPFSFDLITSGAAQVLLCNSRAERELLGTLCGAHRRAQAVVIGPVKLDRLLQQVVNREETLSALGLDASRKTVLVNSHWTETSLFRTIAPERIREKLDDENVNYLVTAHRHLFNPSRVEGVAWRRRLDAVFGGPNFRVLAEVVDNQPLMAAADVMIGDHSSMGLEYSTLMRPMHVFRNPQHPYADVELDQRLRASADVFTSVSEMRAASSFSYELTDDRRRAREGLLGHAFAFLGRSSERAAEVILVLAESDMAGIGSLEDA